ncbi:MAG: hypothetical protein LBI18_12635 [Planctomycetaceae bacterium]|jgi:hypothetical protein|nr:hypothetical protein [Planctomycetaceae bacterium]
MMIQLGMFLFGYGIKNYYQNKKNNKIDPFTQKLYSDYFIVNLFWYYHDVRYCWIFQSPLFLNKFMFCKIIRIGYLACLIFVAIIIILLILLFTLPRFIKPVRTVFAERYAANDRGFYKWDSIKKYSDLDGNIFYIDTEYNIILIISEQYIACNFLNKDDLYINFSNISATIINNEKNQYINISFEKDLIVVLDEKHCIVYELLPSLAKKTKQQIDKIDCNLKNICELMDQNINKASLYYYNTNDPVVNLRLSKEEIKRK